MLRPHRFEREIDPGPVQIQVRKVAFDVSDPGGGLPGELPRCPGRPPVMGRRRLLPTPPDPSGWTRHDLLLGMADVAITGMLAVTGSVRRPRAPRPQDRTITLRVIGRQVVAHDQNVVPLSLADPDRRPLPAWHPGAHLDVQLPSGRVRQYSLCGDPAARDTYRIAVRRIPDGGGGSIEVHDLAVGATVTSNGPRNAFRVHSLPR